MKLTVMKHCFGYGGFGQIERTKDFEEEVNNVDFWFANDNHDHLCYKSNSQKATKVNNDDI